MAALKLLRDTSLAADLSEIVGGLLVDLEAVFAQIGGVGFAAATLRVLVQGRTDRRGDGGERQRHHREGRGQAESSSFHRRFSFNQLMKIMYTQYSQQARHPMACDMARQCNIR